MVLLMKIKLFIFFLLSCLFACQYNKHDISYHITRDTLVNVPLYAQKGFYENDSGIYFYCKPIQYDSLCVYKIGENETFNFYNYLKIPSVFADSVDCNHEVSQWILVNLDTIIALGNQTLNFLDMKNDTVFHTFPLEGDGYVLDALCMNSLQWNKNRQVLPLRYVNYGNIKERTYNGDVEMVAEYSLEKGLQPIAPKYPFEISDSYLKDYTFLPPCLVMLASHEDMFVYAFSTSSLLICYDAKNNKVDSFYLNNENYKPLPQLDTTGMAQISRSNFIGRQSLVNFYYTDLLYDAYKGIYYRFFKKDMPLKNEKGFFNTWDDVIYGVTLIDNKFNIIGDVCFQPKEYRQTNFVTSKGLYSASQKNGNTIIYKLNFDYE